jgi:hypothetical protein
LSAAYGVESKRRLGEQQAESSNSNGNSHNNRSASPPLRTVRNPHELL